VELKLQRTREQLDEARQRVAALQAQLDHLSAKAGLL
jgi:BMFP domain-containing protein YqiC